MDKQDVDVWDEDGEVYYEEDGLDDKNLLRISQKLTKNSFFQVSGKEISTKKG